MLFSIGGNDRLVAFLSPTSAYTRIDFESHTVLTSWETVTDCLIACFVALKQKYDNQDLLSKFYCS